MGSLARSYPMAAKRPCLEPSAAIYPDAGLLGRKYEETLRHCRCKPIGRNFMNTPMVLELADTTGV